MSTSWAGEYSGTGGGGGGRSAGLRPSRYESQKRRDWQTFVRYLAAHRPPLVLQRCSGANVLEFLRYLDRFGKTRVHAPHCAAYGAPAPSSCLCPLRQAWGSLDALVGRLRAAFDERHGHGASQLQQQHDASNPNPFAAHAIRLYLRDIRDAQSRARGISYHNKKKKQQRKTAAVAAVVPSSSRNGGAGLDGEHSLPRGRQRPTTMANAAPVPPLPPLPPCLAGVPLERYDMGSIIGGGGASADAAAGGGYGGIYLPIVFNAFS